MRDEIEFFEADTEERERFSDFERILEACDSEPVLPANRLRSVHRVTDSGRTWFVKRFRATQRKNQWRNLTTEPRARFDGTREARVSEALRAQGTNAPRPVVVARRRGETLYVCAELGGRSLRELCVDGVPDRALADRAARASGSMFRSGFALPDLSADHLFVDLADGEPRFAVLDLHNATIGKPGSVSERTLRRSLRRFRRSVRDLDLPVAIQLRFAMRLLLESGVDAEARRRLLAHFPPLDTRAKYSAGRPERYATRNPKRHGREIELLNAVWPGQPGEFVLDLPCGAGRLGEFLTEKGHRFVGADGAFPMLVTAADRTGQQGFAADATEIPLADRAVDGAVCFRFLHHCGDEVRRSVLHELTRVARRFVVLSTFHPISTHNLQREVRRRLRNEAPRRFAVSNSRLDQEMRQRGFRLVARRAQSPMLRDLWVSAFERTGD